jgi:hypothetical protein
MPKDNVIDFDNARNPHVLKRRDKKVADIKKAFKVARKEGDSKPKNPRRKKKK